MCFSVTYTNKFNLNANVLCEREIWLKFTLQNTNYNMCILRFNQIIKVKDPFVLLLLGVYIVPNNMFFCISNVGG